MGTNYYLEGEKCSHCGQELPDRPRRHIGKSSAGWAFSLHVDPDAGIHSLKDWVRLWDAPGARIVDEYGEAVTPYEMLCTIVMRAGVAHLHDFDHRSNHSELTFNGLVRAQEDGRHCSGHDHATWSHILGEFS